MARKKNQKISIFLGLLIIFLIIIAYGVKNYLTSRAREEQLRAELKKWETIIRQEPSYPDGWVKLAIVWFDLGRKDLSLLTIEEAKNLAPFRDDLKHLEKQLGQR